MNKNWKIKFWAYQAGLCFIANFFFISFGNEVLMYFGLAYGVFSIYTFMYEIGLDPEPIKVDVESGTYESGKSNKQYLRGFLAIYFAVLGGWADYLGLVSDIELILLYRVTYTVGLVGGVYLLFKKNEPKKNNFYNTFSEKSEDEEINFLRKFASEMNYLDFHWSNNLISFRVKEDMVLVLGCIAVLLVFLGVSSHQLYSGASVNPGASLLMLVFSLFGLGFLGLIYSRSRQKENQVLVVNKELEVVHVPYALATFKLAFNKVLKFEEIDYFEFKYYTQIEGKRSNYWSHNYDLSIHLTDGSSRLFFSLFKIDEPDPNYHSFVFILAKKTADITGKELKVINN